MHSWCSCFSRSVHLSTGLSGFKLDQSHFNNTNTHARTLPSYILCLLQYPDKTVSFSLSHVLCLSCFFSLFSILSGFIPSVSWSLSSRPLALMVHPLCIFNSRLLISDHLVASMFHLHFGYIFLPVISFSLQPLNLVICLFFCTLEWLKCPKAT